MALSRVLIVSIAANLMNCLKNVISVGVHKHVLSCFLPACLSSGSALGLVEAKHSYWQSQGGSVDFSQLLSRRRSQMWLRRTQPEVPCFCGSQDLKKEAKGQPGQKQDRRYIGLCCWGSLAGRDLNNSSVPQVGRLSIETRQGHLELWLW